MPIATRRHQPFVLKAAAALIALAAIWVGALSVTAGAAAPAWSVFTPSLGTARTPAARLLDVSCPSRSLCVAVDDTGNALSTTRPASATAAWQSTPIRAGLALDEVSCSAPGFCAAVGVGSFVATSSRPTGAAAAWTPTDLQLSSDGGDGPHPDELLTVGCASASLCVAATFSSESNLAVSLDPGATTPVWTPTTAGDPRGGDLFQAISCPSRRLCVAAGSFGQVATSTDAGRRWRFAYLLSPRDRNGSLTPRIEDVSCPTTTFCAAVDRASHVVTTSNPAGGARAWHRIRLGSRHALTAVSCASASLCAAIDRRGRVLASTRPGRASSWKAVSAGQPVRRVSCASTRLCLLVTRAGGLLAAKHRG
jgi:hypothetical protein